MQHKTGIEIIKANPWAATIWVGLKVTGTNCQHTINDIKDICREYVDYNKWCVTVSPTDFIYTDGGEPGAAIGVIGYPRFPASDEYLHDKTINLAKTLLIKLEQTFITVTFNDTQNTIMLADWDRYNLNERNKTETQVR